MLKVCYCNQNYSNIAAVILQTVWVHWAVLWSILLSCVPYFLVCCCLICLNPSAIWWQSQGVQRWSQDMVGAGSLGRQGQPQSSTCSVTHISSWFPRGLGRNPFYFLPTRKLNVLQTSNLVSVKLAKQQLGQVLQVGDRRSCRAEGALWRDRQVTVMGEASMAIGAVEASAATLTNTIRQL